jgi:hypothetical protein
MSIHRRHLAGAAVLAATLTLVLAAVPVWAQSADEQAMAQAVASLTRAMLAADCAGLRR